MVDTQSTRSMINPHKFIPYHAINFFFTDNSLHGLPEQLYFEISKETVPHALICICSFSYAICLLDKWQCAIMGNHQSGQLAAKQWLLKGCVRVVPIDYTNKKWNHLTRKILVWITILLSHHRWNFYQSKQTTLCDFAFSMISIHPKQSGDIFQYKDSA